MRMRGFLLAAAMAAPLLAQRGQNPAFPGGTNADGSLRPTPPLTRFFTQDAYTQYEILEPGSESFRIQFLPEETRAGATTLVNATRGGSEGSDVEVYDPRTGQPAKFTYGPAQNDPETHEIRATLPIPVPEGGIGRVLIYKTYKDPRTYIMHGEDVVWVRSLSGYRLGVILPMGFALTSSNVAAQMSATDDGRIKLAFANPSGQSNPVTIVAHKSAKFTPTAYTDMFFDDVKTLYTLGDGGSVKVEQTYSDYRKGPAAKLDSLAYLALNDLRVVDLDTAKPLGIMQGKGGTEAKLEVPITNDKQSAHLKLTGTIRGEGYAVSNGVLTFDRAMHGLRNTVVLPAGYELTSCSQSGTVGINQGRVFVALINLNAENHYRVVIHAQKVAK